MKKDLPYLSRLIALYCLFMKMLFLIAVALAQGIVPVCANLGSTETEIIKQYGKMRAAPLSLTNRDVTEYFQQKNCIVAVTLVDGQCQRETFTKMDKKAFTEKEITEILEANSNGSRWMVMNDNDTVKIWVLENKAAFAGYYKVHPYFSLETHKMMEFTEAVKALKDQGARKR